MNLFFQIKNWMSTLLAAVLLAVSIQSAIADWNVVPTASMNPTIVEGDRVLVNKLAYDFRLPFTHRRLLTWNDPRRGDLAVFWAPEKEIPMVKRVVGVPGDSVVMRENRLFINGNAVDYELTNNSQKVLIAPESDYLQRVLIEDLSGRKHPVVLTPYRPSRDSFGPLTIPKGHYFMLGDNRDNSSDSRYFGLVERRRIFGRAAAVMISLNMEDNNRPRWWRFFMPLL